MAIPVALHGDFQASQLRGVARKTKDGPQARRLLAVAAIYDGATRTEAAKIGGVGLQIIRDWVMRFSAIEPMRLLLAISTNRIDRSFSKYLEVTRVPGLQRLICHIQNARFH